MCRKVKEKRPEMGLSSNQARFLSLTARQVDLEQRIQQICQRRLRLSSELENVSTQYNNSISNRKMFTQSMSGMNNISINSLSKVGYKVIDTKTGDLVSNIGLMNKPTVPVGGSVEINSEQDLFDKLVNGGASALSQNYVLNCDIDLSDNSAFTKAVVNGSFTGIFDGQGHTISGANIVSGPSDQNVGFFAVSSGKICNLVLDNAKVTSTGTYTSGGYAAIGPLVGNFTGGGVIDNVAVTNSSVNVGNAYTSVGGMVGGCYGWISNSYAQVSITGGTGVSQVGGLAGDLYDNHITNCYTDGSINVGNGSRNIAGLCSSIDDGLISNCYSTVDITAGSGSKIIGGLVDDVQAAATISSSYAAGNIIAPGGTDVGGFVGTTTGTVDNTNFYRNIATDGAGSSAVNENSSAARPQDSWDKNVWDLSGDLPTLKGTNDISEVLEEGLRNGTYSLVEDADEFTQDPMDINGHKYQEVDWRSTPEIFDELYKGDDVDAENKYDKTISEINSQDKKLQLEQTSVEVEYKAISSERESVKKILDTNAQSSFKYFS